jgi:hypothetical protein
MLVIAGTLSLTGAAQGGAPEPVVRFSRLATASEAATTASFRCLVAKPTPGQPRPHFNFGTNRIAVALPPRATFVAVPEGKAGGAWVMADGWIRTKVGWWAAVGGLRVTGRRLDRPDRPLRADVGPLSHAVPGGPFYPSLLYFPGPGCWRLTAHAGQARLDAVVRVTIKQ